MRDGDSETAAGDGGLDPAFSFACPRTLEEASRLAMAHGAGALLLAGGTDAVVHLVKGLRSPRCVIDLKGVAELSDEAVETPDGFRIGALAPMADLMAHPGVRAVYPALVEAMAVVGSVQIRNRATLAGNACNASPAADTLPALLAFEARIEIYGPAGRRCLPIEVFCTGPGRTALGAGEMVEALWLPRPPAGAGSAFARLSRRRGMDLATVSAACRIAPDGQVRMAYGAVGPTPMLATCEDTALLADDAEEAAAERIAWLADHARPIGDIRSGAAYRRAMTAVLTRRVLRAARARMGAPTRPSDAGPAPAPPRIPDRGRDACGSAARTEPACRTSARHGPGPAAHAVHLTVNGRRHRLRVAADETLLHLLRDRLDLTGTKECCGEGECGACTVLWNGRAVNACIVLAVEADGGEILTIEGLDADGRLDPVQEAFLDSGAVQCGFCTPGMIMAAKALVMRNVDPTEAEVREALCGNLCRCTGYVRIFAAVRQAAAALRTP